MVRDVVEHAARVTRAVQLAKPMESYRARPMLLALAAVASLIVATYAYVARAPWVFGPSPHHLQPAAREGHVRYAMFLTVARVLTFRDSTGNALPRTLAQVGESWPGMSYHVQQDTFELRAHIDSSKAIVYRSTQDPAELAASATSFLRDRLP